MNLLQELHQLHEASNPLVTLAKRGNLKVFIDAFEDKHNSSASMFLSATKQKKLMKCMAAGHEIKVLPFKSEDAVYKAEEDLAKKDWKLLGDGDNGGGQVEAIFTRGEDEDELKEGDMEVSMEDALNEALTVAKGWKKVKTADPDYHQFQHEVGHEIKIAKKGENKEYQGPMGMMGKTHTSKVHHMMTRKAGTDNWQEYGHVTPYEFPEMANRAFNLREERSTPLDRKLMAMEDGLKAEGMKDVNVERTGHGDYVHFTHKGNDFSVKMPGTLFVTGYKDSIEVDSGLKSAVEAVNAANSVNKKWMKENDPYYERGT